MENLEAQRSSRHCAANGVVLEGGREPANTPPVRNEFGRATNPPLPQDAARAPDGSIRIVPGVDRALRGQEGQGAPVRLPESGITVIPKGCIVPDGGDLQNMPATPGESGTGIFTQLPSIVGQGPNAPYQNLPYVIKCGDVVGPNGTPPEPQPTTPMPAPPPPGADLMAHGRWG